MNNNTISINLVPNNNQQTQTLPESPINKPQQTELAITNKVFDINIKTDTDWASISVSGIGVTIALIVGIFSYVAQRNQVRANIATIRNRWLEELRETSAKFIELMSLIANNINDDQDYLKKPESTDIYCQLIYTQSKFTLMLDRTKVANQEIIELTKKIIETIKNTSDSQEEKFLVMQQQEQFETKVSNILEKAWQDIKHDIN